MKYKMQNQRGSAHIFIIICLVVILLFALGWIFWRNFVYKEPVKTNSQLIVVKPKADANSSTPSSTAKSFAIKEWDVKFEIPASLQDTTIQYAIRSIGDAQPYIALTTARTVALGGDCAQGYPFGDIVTLQRNTKATSDQYSKPVQADPIGGYYYQYDDTFGGLVPASTCTNNSVAKDDQAALVTALKTLTVNK